MTKRLFIIICLLATGCQLITDFDGYLYGDGDSESDTGTDTVTDTDSVTDTNSETDTGSGPGFGSDGDTDTDTGTGTDVSSDSDTYGYADTNVDTNTDTCQFQLEASRICTVDGNVQVLDQCNATIEIIPCASVNGGCEDGECGCASGWSGDNCDTCLVYVKSGLASYEGNDGRSWASALDTIQAALDVAEILECEVWVATGNYLPTKKLDSADERTATIQLASNVAIYGGFVGNEKHRRERDSVTNPTILSGDIGISGDNTDNAYHVVTGADNATIDGFIITSGNANGSEPHDVGGGMLNDASSPSVTNCTFSNNRAFTYGAGMCNLSSSPLVTNCIFIDNVDVIGGGGMSNNASSPVVTNCKFAGNEADFGGGMYNRDNSSPTVTHCTFENNSASRGGGLRNSLSSSPFVINCVFSHNSAGDSGGAMENLDSSMPTVTNCIFTGNSAYSGGGIANRFSSSPRITNCTVIKNTANSGGGIFNESASSPTVSNCILWGNTATEEGNEIFNFESDTEPSTPIVSFSAIQGGYSGDGNIDMDPRVVNSDKGNFRLSSDSPCINAGSLGALPGDAGDLDSDDNVGENTPFDLDGNPRHVGASVDMGAYEYQDLE
ncbi:MAG: right-handed parallel beta-helix repeat-containing protein [Deltaproteobacteria bacterium]|nr:right-handed parallel beta-helix repeat-containing protein [Deltaproteobacteria bacterium]